MAHKYKMTRAKNDVGLIVSIEFVSNGLSCNCVCLSCGAKLIAKQGEMNGKTQANHFSHRPGDSKRGSCTWSYETDVHIIAKEVLAITKHLSVTLHGPLPDTMSMNFDSVIKEINLPIEDSKLRPDLTAQLSDDVAIASSYEGETVYIEIAVTHKCEQEKVIELRRLNLNVIEIDLQDFIPNGDTVRFEDVENYIADKAPKKWIAIKPAGGIGSQVNAQAKTVILDLLDKQRVEKQNLSETQRNLALVVKQQQNEIKKLNNLREELALCKDEVREHEQAIDNLGEDFARNRQRLINELKIEFANSNKYNQETADELTQEVKDLNQEISDLYDNKMQEYERAKKEIPNIIRSNEMLAQQIFNDRFTQLRQDLYNSILAENNELTRQINESTSQLNNTVTNINKAEIKLKKLNSECSYLRSFEVNLKERERITNVKEEQIRTRSQLHVQASRHLERLFPELRAIARKNGVAWPFEDNLVDELKRELPECINEF